MHSLANIESYMRLPATGKLRELQGGHTAQYLPLDLLWHQCPNPFFYTTSVNQKTKQLLLLLQLLLPQSPLHSFADTRPYMGLPIGIP